MVNLSGHLLTKDQLELLALSLRYRLAPSFLPWLKFIAGIESAFSDLRREQPEHAYRFRAEAAHILDKAKSPALNLSVNLLKAAKSLSRNENLVITTADKGGRTVVLHADQYAEMCFVHLQDDAYEEVRSLGTGRHKVFLTDPKTKLDNKVLSQDFSVPDVSDRLLQLQSSKLQTLLRNLHSKKQISTADFQYLSPIRPYSGVIPRFYGLPKLHKVGRLKIRPIISNFGIYCDKALLHIKNILNLLPTNQTSVSHSYQLSSILDNFEFGPNDQLVSFDVQSLFTRVPVPETLVIVCSRLEKLRRENPEILSTLTSFSNDAIMELLQFLLADC